MATCSSCGGVGGRVTLGGWVQCDGCGGSGQQDDPVIVEGEGL